MTTPTFTGEVQFRRYSDTSTQGVQIVLGLADRESLEPFISKAGKRFMAVLVEIGDDELPVEPTPRKDTRGPLCREACDLCENAVFQCWIALDEPPSKEAAKARIIKICGLEKSRSELDTNPAAAHKFVQVIRLGFMRATKGERPALAA
jgi:hypothetical protein